MRFSGVGGWGWASGFGCRISRVYGVGFLGLGVGIRDLGLGFRNRARSGILARLRSEVFLTPDLLPIPIQLESPFPIKASTVGGNGFMSGIGTRVAGQATGMQSFGTQGAAPRHHLLKSHPTWDEIQFSPNRHFVPSVEWDVLS